MASHIRTVFSEKSSKLEKLPHDYLRESFYLGIITKLVCATIVTEQCAFGDLLYFAAVVIDTLLKSYENMVKTR
jgi:hypothetical protein